MTKILCILPQKRLKLIGMQSYVDKYNIKYLKSIKYNKKYEAKSYQGIKSMYNYIKASWSMK